MFPEIDYDKVDEIWGMDVIVCTTAATDDEARELLRGFNFPFPQLEDLGTSRKAFGGLEWPRRAQIEKNNRAAQAGRAVRREAQAR